MVISPGAIAMNGITDCKQIIETVRKKPTIVLVNKTSYLEFGDV